MFMRVWWGLLGGGEGEWQPPDLRNILDLVVCTSFTRVRRALGSELTAT